MPRYLLPVKPIIQGLLLRVDRDHGEKVQKVAVEQTSTKLKKALADLKMAQTLETIRSIEGNVLQNILEFLMK